ncbi:hypothetical protein I4U23_024921 [Adineta vaga]|nr:hypothetical protein I4U23_024921 [Adineta vaga]
MTTRSTSSSSSSSETEITSERIRATSETSGDITRTESHLRQDSPTNTIDGTSIADTTTVRSASPTASHLSQARTHTTFDSASVATGFSTGTVNTQPQLAGGIPIIRPPGLQQQQQGGTGIGVFGPQRPVGYPTQPPSSAGNINQQPIQIDVAAAQQQYQQRGMQPEISPYSGSTTSSSAGSLSVSAATSSHQQPRFDAAKAIFNQADTNKDGSISRDEFNTWAQQGGNSAAGGQFQQQQQTQFPNQIPASQVYNELLGPDAFKDVILDIDYGAMAGFNVAFQSGGDFNNGQLPPGINVRPAYTTVDSLNYQQHMFNTARTINAGSQGDSYDFNAANNSYAGTDGQQFDVARAIFNQADANQDGSISRDEFRQWAQGSSQQNQGGQAYSASANYQASYGNQVGGTNNSIYQAALFDGANPAVANILQQSGLGQVVPN